MVLISYLKRQWKLLLLLCGAAAVFAAVFALYDLPVEAVAYAALLCLALGAVLFGLGYSAFLRRQPELDRGLFIRRYFYLDSVAALAARFGMNQGQVKTRLHRLRERLKKALEAEGVVV